MRKFITLNKTRFTSLFPELYDNNLIENTWYYYTKPTDIGSIAYFKGWNEDSGQGERTFGVNSSGYIMETDAWFTTRPGMARIAENYRAATDKEILDAFRKSFNNIHGHGLREGRKVVYRGQLYILKNEIIVDGDDVYIEATNYGITPDLLLPVYINGKLNTEVKKQ